MKTERNQGSLHRGGRSQDRSLYGHPRCCPNPDKQEDGRWSCNAV